MIENLWHDVKAHLVKNTSDACAKFLAVRRVVTKGVLGDGFDSQSRKIVDRLTPQVRQLLESAVVLNDMQFEVRGFVFAVKLLRPGLRDNRGISLPMKRRVKIGGEEEEEGEEDEPVQTVYSTGRLYSICTL